MPGKDNTEIRTIPFKANKERISGGGQIEFLDFDETRGMRVLGPGGFTDSESPSVKLEEEVRSYGLRTIVLESTLSLCLTDQPREVVPKLHGIGLLIPESEDSFFIEIDPIKSKQEGIFEALQFIYQRGCELRKSGAEPRIFSLVEKVPVANSKDQVEINKEKYYSPTTLLKKNPRAYEKGLVAGLQFYQQCMQQGIWNFDINGKDPFIIDGNGNAKVIDTSGFVTLKNGELEGSVQAFYEFEIAEREAGVRDEVISAYEHLPDQEQKEYDALSNQREELLSVGQRLLNQLQITDRLYKTSNVLTSLEAKGASLLEVGNERRYLNEKLTQYQNREILIKRNQEVEKSASLARKERNLLYTPLNEIEYVLMKHQAAKKFNVLTSEYISPELQSSVRRSEIEKELKEIMSLAGTSRSLSQDWGEFCTASIKQISDRYEELGSSPDIEIEKCEAKLLEINADMERLNLIISAGEKQTYIEPIPIGAIESTNERLSRLKTDEEVASDQKKIIEVREIVHSEIRYQMLEEKKIGLDQAAQKRADTQIQNMRDTCFNSELSKVTGRTLEQSNLANLLKECGFERYLDTLTQDLANPLSEVYTKIQSNSYHSDLSGIFETIINLIPNN